MDNEEDQIAIVSVSPWKPERASLSLLQQKKPAGIMSNLQVPLTNQTNKDTGQTTDQKS